MLPCSLFLLRSYKPAAAIMRRAHVPTAKHPRTCKLRCLSAGGASAQLPGSAATCPPEQGSPRGLPGCHAVHGLRQAHATAAASAKPAEGEQIQAPHALVHREMHVYNIACMFLPGLQLASPCLFLGPVGSFMASMLICSWIHPQYGMGKLTIPSLPTCLDALCAATRI